MKIAVLSDIHGNLEAFRAVVASIEVRRPDRVVCLGDMVGYGPEPEEVVQLFRDLQYDCILGNHELAMLEKIERRRLNFQARENNIRTEKLLSKGSLKYCRGLSPSFSIHNAHFVHGFPPDSVHKYAYNLSDKTLLELFESSNFSHYFVGHTHKLNMVTQDGDVLVRSALKEGKISFVPDQKYLITVGSVGQPREEDNRAKYVVWDSDEKTLEVVYVSYDIESTIRKIKARGFPEAYGIRLK